MGTNHAQRFSLDTRYRFTERTTQDVGETVAVTSRTRVVSLRTMLSAGFDSESPTSRLNRLLQRTENPIAIIGTDREAEFRGVEGYQTVRAYAAAQDAIWLRRHNSSTRVPGTNRIVPRGTLVLSRQRTEELGGIRRRFEIDRMPQNIQAYYNQVEKLYLYGKINRQQFTRYWNAFQHAGESDQRGVAERVSRGVDFNNHARFIRDCLAHLRRH